MLGILLFVTYNVVNIVSKFDDDTKIGGIADSEERYVGLQQDLDLIKDWKSTVWLQQSLPRQQYVCPFLLCCFIVCVKCLF